MVPTTDESPHVPPFWQGEEAHSPPGPDGCPAAGAGSGEGKGCAAGSAEGPGPYAPLEQQQPKATVAEQTVVSKFPGPHGSAPAGHTATLPPPDGSAVGSNDDEASHV